MKTLNQKKLLVLFGALLFAGFLLSIPQVTYAAPVFTAGWYQDNGNGEVDATCPEGKWRASIELRDDLEEPLLVDKLTIRAIWYEEATDVGIEIYNTEAVSLSSHIFETDCVIDIKDGTGSIALEVIAEKDGYYTMLVTNSYRTGGSFFNQKIWRKTLYLASLARVENPNIVYLLPDNDQWISNREEHSGMRLWVNKFPLADNITQVDIEIIHLPTAQKFFLSKTGLSIAEGEVVFSLPALTKIGEYSWQVKLVRSSVSTFYNENTISYFNFDPNPPTPGWISANGWSIDGETQAPRIRVPFTDPPLPSSGICRIEIYINDGPGTPLPSEPVRSCSFSPCTYIGEYQEYTTSTTYIYYAIGYDCAGNETTTEERSFTINPLEPPSPPDPSRLTIYSRVDNVGIGGVPFDVINVTNVINGGDVPVIGAYETATTFESTAVRYRIHLEAPDSYNGREFSFWTSAGGNYFSNSTGTSLNVQQDSTSELTMNFGVSRLDIRPRGITNLGFSMDWGLQLQILQTDTRVEQTGGLPGDLLGATGYRDLDFSDYYQKTVVGGINDLALRFHDSDDDILKFSHFENYIDSTRFCEPDPEDGQQCQGSISYRYGRVKPNYSIQRTVRVESYLGNDPEVPAEGVEITASGGMQEGTTNAEGYYTFSSTGQPGAFTGILTAPELIIDSDGDAVLFNAWEGCFDTQPDDADEFDCYIGTEVTWNNNVAATVVARYAGSGGPEPRSLNIDITGDGTVESDVGDICCGCTPSVCFNDFVLNTPVTLTANITNTDYYFAGWSDAEDWDDCEAFDDNPCELNMSSNKQARAEFALITYELTTGSTLGGSVTTPGEPGPYIYDIHTVVPLEATANSNYRFVNWTGTDVSTVADVNSAITTITMEDDYTITANFEEIIIRADSVGCQHLNYCFAETAPVQLEWQFYSNIGSTQESYQAQVATDLGFTNKIADSNVVPTDYNKYTPASLDFNTDYYWRVKVWDDDGNESAWFPSPPLYFPTRPEYPWPRFNWSPGIPFVGGPTQFCSIEETGLCEIIPDYDARIDWTICPSSPCTWFWTFEDGTTPDPNIWNPEVIFTVTGDNGVTLTVTDSGGFFCTEDRDVTVSLPLPEYREVAPTSWLDSFLARLGNIFARF